MVSICLNIDEELDNELKPMAPHMSTFSIDKPYAISSDLAFTKPVASTISNFVHLRSDPRMHDPVLLAKTLELAEC